MLTVTVQCLRSGYAVACASEFYRKDSIRAELFDMPELKTANFATSLLRATADDLWQYFAFVACKRLAQSSPFLTLRIGKSALKWSLSYKLVQWLFSDCAVAMQ